MFNPNLPTVQMLGRWQPWHEGHTALFKKALATTGQVSIMVRDTEDGGDNPFNYKDVIKNFPDAELINVKSKDKGNDHD